MIRTKKDINMVPLRASFVITTKLGHEIVVPYNAEYLGVPAEVKECIKALKKEGAEYFKKGNGAV